MEQRDRRDGSAEEACLYVMDGWMGGGRADYVRMQELSTKASTKEEKKICKMEEMLNGRESDYFLFLLASSHLHTLTQA